MFVQKYEVIVTEAWDGLLEASHSMKQMSCDIMILAKAFHCSVLLTTFCLTTAFSLSLGLAEYFVDPGFPLEIDLFNNNPLLKTEVCRRHNC